jgi:hypothetical protein
MGRMTQDKIDLIRILNKSSLHFISHVWPIIGEVIGGGEIIPVEGVTDSSFAKNLDMIAGIDAWQIFKNDDGMKCMRGIASRVQWYRKEWARSYPFNTFTIRYSLVSGSDTEYDKRVYAINNKNDYILFPAITIQSYLSEIGLPIFSIGVIFTKELIRAAINHKWPEIKVEYGNTMLKLSWNELVKLDYNVYVYESPDCKLQLNLFA